MSRKILLASPYGGIPGGISRWTEHILKYHQAFGQEDCELDILPMGRTVFVRLDAPLVKRFYDAVKDYRHIFSLFNIKLKDHRYDVMHLTTSASISLLKDIYMLEKAHRKSLRTVIHFRFGRIPELAKQKNWEWRLLKRVLKIADVAIVIDETSCRVLKNSGFENVMMLPNPVAPKINKIIENNGNNVPRDVRTILFVGHVIPTKGVYELLDACMQIPDIQLKLIGHVSPEIKEDLLNRCGNASWVDICGEKDYEEIIEAMLRCGVFVLPTYTEGFPNVILESMACGCPIVTTSVGAIPEMLDIEHGMRCGICISPKDVEGLKSSIEKMLSDRDYASNCGKNAKYRVMQQYSMPVVWKKLVEVWNSIK